MKSGRFSISWAGPGCSPVAEAWLARLRTVRAMALLCLAGLVVGAGPFRIWRRRVGGRHDDLMDRDRARRLAAQVDRAAWRLPFASKCLPRAVALSWMLRRRRLAHALVLAVRPLQERGGSDDLHAWIECGEAVILGDLPGPWIRIHTAGQQQGAPPAECN